MQRVPFSPLLGHQLYCALVRLTRPYVVQVLGFPSHEEVDAWMLDHPDQTIGAVHFDVDVSNDNLFVGYTIQTNSTVSCTVARAPPWLYTLQLELDHRCVATPSAHPALLGLTCHKDGC